MHCPDFRRWIRTRSRVWLALSLRQSPRKQGTLLPQAFLERGWSGCIKLDALTATLAPRTGAVIIALPCDRFDDVLAGGSVFGLSLRPLSDSLDRLFENNRLEAVSASPDSVLSHQVPSWRYSSFHVQAHDSINDASTLTMIFKQLVLVQPVFDRNRESLRRLISHLPMCSSTSMRFAMNVP